MRVTVQNIGSHSLEKAHQMLAGYPGGVDKAVRAAMGRAASHLRTNAVKEIRKRYDISANAVRAEQNVTVKYSYTNGVEATVHFSGLKIPLYRYGGTTPSMPTADTTRLVNALIAGNWKKVHPGVAASAHQLTASSLTKFDSAFVARMKSGHLGIFERNENGGISELMGSSVPQMLGNEEVAENLSKQAMEKFDERLDHEITRIILGYGG